MALPEYTVLIRRRKKVTNYSIDEEYEAEYINLEFQHLTIIEKVNDLGSWKISSVSRELPDIIPGDGIIVSRNGIKLYSGVFQRLESTYLYTQDAWNWTASGVSDLAYFNWMYVRPAYTAHYYFSDRYLFLSSRYLYYISSTYTSIIDHIVNNVLCMGTDSSTGYQIIKGTTIYDDDPIIVDGEVALRMDNGLDAIQLLAQKAEVAVIPQWDFETGKLNYFINRGHDLSNTVIFSMDNGTVDTVKRIFQEPSVTKVAYSYNSDAQAYESGDSQMWHYVYERRIGAPQDDDNSALWIPGRWDSRVETKTPSKAELEEISNRYRVSHEDSLYYYSRSDIKKYLRYSDISYEVILRLREEGPQYKRDFDMGDYISVILPDGTRYEDKVYGSQIEYSFGEETFSKSLTNSASGAYNVIYRDIEKMKQELSSAKKGETE